ncbi:hypothetical protein [Bremerella alba]|uniref:Alpha/beta hydrolase n=1 Tax=Bremerella alba TaxID=980252 RepID=A0A7V9A5P0_9BACT|nr:hypothetical protein [Bremerella alba]MBA2113555.1 hypothetical protein [Bremerella alba]
MLRNLLSYCVILFAATAQPAWAEFGSGKGVFEFTDQQGNADRPIKVWYYQPPDFAKDGRVLFIMHGVGRNADGYRDAWIDIADAQNLLLLVPEFSDQAYPSSRLYQQGYVLTKQGDLRKRSLWSLMAVERIFDHVVHENELRATRYSIYGHSGGGQFVHRMLLLNPNARVELAIAANAGWYAMPDLTVGYPYGLAGIGANTSQLRLALGKPLVVLLGEADTDSNHKQLRSTPEAMLQGKHRLERGKTFFESGKRLAEDLNVEFHWQLQTVPGVSHSNTKMAPAAGQILKRDSG